MTKYIINWEKRLTLVNKFLQFLGLAKKSGNLIEGYNKCEELIKRNGLSLLILSTDCSTNTKDKFTKYCMNYSVPFIESFSKEELGAPIGRFEISIIGIVDRKISDKLLSLWNEQNNTNTRGWIYVKNKSLWIGKRIKYIK